MKKQLLTMAFGSLITLGIIGIMSSAEPEQRECITDIYLKKISKDEIDRSLEHGSRRFYELQNDNNHPSLGNRMKINCRYAGYARYAKVAFQSLDGTYYKLTIEAEGN
jgi:hypothetical protein